MVVPSNRPNVLVLGPCLPTKYRHPLKLLNNSSRKNQTCESTISENSIPCHCFHSVWIGVERSSWSHSEKSRLRVNGVEFSIFFESHPSNVISNALSLPTTTVVSTPVHKISYPGKEGVNMAKFVFPQALGKAAAMYFFSPDGEVNPKINMCSASHPSSLPRTDAILKAKHFLPRRAFPPYPLPYENTSLVSGKWQMVVFSGSQGQGTS